MMDGGGSWWWMGGGSFVFVVVIVFVAWVLVRQAQPLPQAPTPRVRKPTRSAEDVLAERYARGEIDEQEYRSRRDVLRQ
jgi:putative membrane protein